MNRQNLPDRHPFEAKIQPFDGKARVLECWMIHLGGDAYLGLDAASNYFVTKNMNMACRFALSDHNEKLTAQIMKTLGTKPGFGTPRRMLVRWPQGSKVSPINEVRA